MKKWTKQTMSALLVLVLVLSLLSGITLPAKAESTVTYRYGSWSKYTNIIYNWGTREEVATFLSPNAITYYESKNFSYDTYAGYSGNATVSSTPNSQLFTQLYNFLSDAQDRSNSYDDNRNLSVFTDCQQNGAWQNGAISCFYTGKALGPAWDSGKTWNREHTWPQSKGGNPIENIMMIRPTSSNVNSSRGNKAYGASSNYYNPNVTTYDLRGDVARLMLFAWVRWGKDYPSTIMSNMWGSSGVFESKAVMLDWIEADPVDTWEMGRNDSVESILGVRNVFVDYPELAFDLFEEPVPEDMVTPSGTSYKITAVSSNTAHGTVSVSGKRITAYPSTGYQVSGYTVTAGSAQVTRNGNVFTVNATEDCTIRINFVPRVQYTLSFVENGVTQSTVKAYGSDSVTLPAHTGTVPQGYSFGGWTTSRLTETQSKPATVYAAGSSMTVTGNQTLYALYFRTEGGTGVAAYEKVTSASQIGVGSKVVIVANSANSALSTTQTTVYRGLADITKSGNTISFAEDAGVAVLTLGAGTTAGTYSFYCDAANATGYLSAPTGTTTNSLLTVQTVDGYSSFTITPGTDSCSIVASSGAKNVLCYNASSPRFACYGSQQSPVSLYVQTVQGTIYYTTDISWENPPAQVDQYNVALGDDLNLNFRIDAEAEHADSVTVQVLVKGEQTQYGLSQLQKDESGKYLLSVELTACDMTETVTVSLTAAGLPISSTQYSVYDYALSVLEGDYPETTKNLVRAMLHYGAKAQTYFGVNTDKLANEGVEAVASTALPAMSDAYLVRPTGKVGGVSIYAASLICRSKTTVRFYFESMGNAIANVTVQVNGKEYTPVKSGSRWYIDVCDIGPEALNQALNLTVTSASGDVLSIHYSPLQYLVKMNHSSTDTTLKNVLQAMYDYHLYAQAYCQ